MSLPKMTKKESDLWRKLISKIHFNGIDGPSGRIEPVGICALLRWYVLDSPGGQEIFFKMADRFEREYGYLENGPFGMYYWSFKPYGYRQRKKVCLKFANEYKTRKKD